MQYSACAQYPLRPFSRPDIKALISPPVRLSEISVKTGTVQRAGTDCRLHLKVCDQLQNCCYTESLNRYS